MTIYNYIVTEKSVGYNICSENSFPVLSFGTTYGSKQHPAANRSRPLVRCHCGRNYNRRHTNAY